MSKEEIIRRIKRNKNPKHEAINLIADFLVIKRNEATKIYEEEIEKCSIIKK